MTKKHFPGPWAFDQYGLVFAGKNRTHIAQVATTGMGHQAAGNSALIAAAPELLAQLENLCRLSIWKGASDYDRAQVEAAMAAIKQATA
jgi:hypothetical protein